MADCFATSVHMAERNPGWQVVMGYFDMDPLDELDGWRSHTWNVMEDGRIYDATCDQFGVPAPLITDPDNPCYVADLVCTAAVLHNGR